MKYSIFFPKTLRQVPSGAESVNHQLLVRAGFIDQLMAGSWTLLPLGLRVVSKINDIIRDELNKTEALEMQMPLLHPREIWDSSGRWDDPGVKEIMYQFKDIHDREYGLSFTHEEIVMNLLGKHNLSYKDFPIKVYQFSTKFRNEPRAKSGILRGREFMMKDLYSAHVSEEDLYEYYNKVKEAYVQIFNRIGFEGTKIVEASGGVFTKNYTHEFQVLSPVGEDTIYFCSSCDFAQNKEVFEPSLRAGALKEVFKGEVGGKCPNCDGKIESASSIEVGNIFPLGTKYSENMKVFFKDESGQEKPIHFASYGIGPTRVMGTLVEIFHDEKGIIWPDSIAPFKVHLAGLNLDDKHTEEYAEKIYKLLQAEGIEVLFDDRKNASPGEKFADADLIGIPNRVVISKKLGEELEVKKRGEDKTEFMKYENLLEILQN
jgi:prolyl-tRNA synthetase